MTAARRLDEVIHAQLQDPDIRREWERTALARAVALSVVRYRTEHQLSQRRLAEQLGWKQAQVGRLELGEHTPSLETLLHLSHKLGLEFIVAIQPARRTGARLVTIRDDQASIVERLTTRDGGELLIAAG